MFRFLADGIFYFCLHGYLIQKYPEEAAESRATKKSSQRYICVPFAPAFPADTDAGNQLGIDHVLRSTSEPGLQVVRRLWTTRSLRVNFPLTSFEAMPCQSRIFVASGFSTSGSPPRSNSPALSAAAEEG
jgi:hypothetical protein